MTKIIGLTGGIGSGKTTIVNFLKILNIPVYNADEEAKRISESPEVLHKIKASFEIVFKNGKLNRKKLAEIIFSDAEKLERLNSIIHPHVMKHFLNWLIKHSDALFVIKEAAILFETGSYKECDLVITVIAPMKERIKRVMQRDKISYENIIKRMNNQWTDDKKIEKSHYVVENLNLNSAEMQIMKNLKKLIIQ